MGQNWPTRLQAFCWLNNHKNLFIFTDKEASYKSEEEVNRLIKQRQKKLEIKEREERLQNEELKKDR